MVKDTQPDVRFLWFAGCPLAAPARANLEAALAQCGVAHYETIDLMSPDTLPTLQAWGSPTILIDGEDVTGEVPGGSACCRLYVTPERVPATADIVAAIKRAQGLH